MIGPSPNPLILSYLKYAISSQVRAVQVQVISRLHEHFKPNRYGIHIILWCILKILTFIVNVF